MKTNLVIPTILFLIVLMCVGCGKNVTAIERQDRANLRAAIYEMERYIASNAPSVPALADVPDTSPLVALLPGTTEARGWRDALTFATLAKSAAANVCATDEVTPIELERGEYLCSTRDFPTLFEINRKAKLVAGKNMVDQWSYLLFGVSFFVLASAVVLWGIRQIIMKKAPAILPLFDSLVSSVDKVRMDTPTSIAEDIERIIDGKQGVVKADVEELVKRRIDDALRAAQKGNRKLKVAVQESKARVEA